MKTFHLNTMTSSRCYSLVLLAICSVSSLFTHASVAAEPKRSFIAADSSKQRIAIIGEDGKTAWETKIGPLHDLHVLPNGNVLFQKTWTEIAEVNPKSGETTWSYDAKAIPSNKSVPMEIHAFQRLSDGKTMVAESGPGRIIELDPQLKVTSSMALKVSRPDPHRDTRLVRKLASGNYLVCHEGDGLVREYEPSGKIAWEYKVPLFNKQPKPGHGVEAFGNQAFSALRLSNGNTLIGAGNGHSVLEVSPQGEIVWNLHQNDLEGIQLAWVTSLQVLPSGNILINNCHAGPKNPQLIEVNRDRKVVWSFHDFERFGDSLTNSQILTIDGKPIAASDVLR